MAAMEDGNYVGQIVHSHKMTPEDYDTCLSFKNIRDARDPNWRVKVDHYAISAAILYTAEYEIEGANMMRKMCEHLALEMTRAGMSRTAREIAERLRYWTNYHDRFEKFLKLPGVQYSPSKTRVTLTPQYFLRFPEVPKGHEMFVNSYHICYEKLRFLFANCNIFWFRLQVYQIPPGHRLD